MAGQAPKVTKEKSRLAKKRLNLCSLRYAEKTPHPARLGFVRQFSASYASLTSALNGVFPQAELKTVFVKTNAG